MGTRWISDEELRSMTDKDISEADRALAQGHREGSAPITMAIAGKWCQPRAKWTTVGETPSGVPVRRFAGLHALHDIVLMYRAGNLSTDLYVTGRLPTEEQLADYDRRAVRHLAARAAEESLTVTASDYRFFM